MLLFIIAFLLQAITIYTSVLTNTPLLACRPMTIPPASSAWLLSFTFSHQIDALCYNQSLFPKVMLD